MKLLLGDCVEEMKKLADNSVDAVVTDPPYGLSFMGKKWDYDVPSQEIWEECLRVLKPGGYLLAFAGTRTQHRMAVRIENAGFEIRDMIAWVYGSGFPKSLNIGKAVEKLQGKEVSSTYVPNNKNNTHGKGWGGGITDTTPADNEWNGWGTALKPALEPITVARKPLSEKTVAENCLRWGVGGINVDGCRVESDGSHMVKGTVTKRTTVTGDEREGKALGMYGEGASFTPTNHEGGRFPANLIHDGSDEVVSLFPNNNARFFYCSKASKSERSRGCEELEEKKPSVFDFRPTLETNRENWATPIDETPYGRGGKMKNNHPTVKPIALMEYLVKLVSREGAVVLDPFMGSGSTGIACKNLNRNFIGIEREAQYVEIAKARIQSVTFNNTIF